MQQSKLNHMMIDVETLGLAEGTTVIAIGVVLFNPETGEFGQKRHYLPPTDTQGGTVDLDTVSWWLRTGPAQLQNMLARNPEHGTPATWDEVADDIAVLTKTFNVDTLWANGIDFDLPILSAALDRCADSNPVAEFTYQQRRCLRQWKFAATHSGWEPTPRPDNLPKHNALADATWQAQVACSLWAYLTK